MLCISWNILSPQMSNMQGVLVKENMILSLVNSLKYDIISLVEVDEPFYLRIVNSFNSVGTPALSGSTVPDITNSNYYKNVNISELSGLSKSYNVVFFPKPVKVGKYEYYSGTLMFIKRGYTVTACNVYNIYNNKVVNSYEYPDFVKSVLSVNQQSFNTNINNDSNYVNPIVKIRNNLTGKLYLVSVLHLKSTDSNYQVDLDYSFDTDVVNKLKNEFNTVNDKTLIDKAAQLSRDVCDYYKTKCDIFEKPQVGTTPAERKIAKQTCVNNVINPNVIYMANLNKFQYYYSLFNFFKMLSDVDVGVVMGDFNTSHITPHKPFSLLLKNYHQPSFGTTSRSVTEYKKVDDYYNRIIDGHLIYIKDVETVTNIKTSFKTLTPPVVSDHVPVVTKLKYKELF